MKLKLKEVEDKDLKDGKFYFILWNSGYFGMVEFDETANEFCTGDEIYEWGEIEKIFEPPHRDDMVGMKQDGSPVLTISRFFSTLFTGSRR